MPGFDTASGNCELPVRRRRRAAHRLAARRGSRAQPDAGDLRALGINSLRAVAAGDRGSRPCGRSSAAAIRHRAAPRRSTRCRPGTDVDIEGAGEILHVGATPVAGQRTRHRRRATGCIVDCDFVRLPLPYAIERAGYRPGLVALTFDDGPDPTWTPQILDILKAKHVPATFFVIGENALTERGLLDREIAEGHEVGNHTYTHPNLGEATARRDAARAQRHPAAVRGVHRPLDAAVPRALFRRRRADHRRRDRTGRRRRRALGYLRSASTSIRATGGGPASQRSSTRRRIDGVDGRDPTERSGNVILLHDGGGDRSQTVAALPPIIDELRAAATASCRSRELVGLSPAQVMPPLPRDELRRVGDRPRPVRHDRRRHRRR